MSFGNWNSVINDYRNVYLNSRYADHSKGILSLIPKLVDDPALIDVLPGTSHATLFLQLPTKRTQVHVWCNRPDEEYVVYLYHSTTGESNRSTVSGQQIVEAVKKYVDQVRKMDQ